MDGQTVHVQIISENATPFSDYLGILQSQPDTLTVILGFTCGPATPSGNTIMYVGCSGMYTNLNRSLNTETIVSGTMTLTISSAGGVGAAVNGSVSFTTTARTLTGTFTGTVIEVD